MARSPFARHWSLDESIVFLNHGSFGACPSPVLELQQRLRQQLEAEPVRFLARELEPLLAEARIALGRFLGADAADLAFVTNATAGVNTVLRSLRFSPGDELLTTNQAYNACRNALDAVAEREGARVVVAEVPFPIDTEQAVVDAVLAAATERTRLVLLDHVTSPTGAVWPVTRIVRELAARGIDTLVDGAHAPGMLPLDLHAIGAAYYTGNCHKWLCAPKGAAFLHVRQDRQHRIRPLVISHGANSPRTDLSRFRLEFDWMGTQDPTAWLCIPEALRFLATLLPGGWPALMATNRARALEARRLLCDALDAAPPCPDDMVGSLAAVALPDGDAESLQQQLFARHRIEVPIVPWPRAGKRWVRISSQVYNTREEYEQLARALVQLARP